MSISSMSKMLCQVSESIIAKVQISIMTDLATHCETAHASEGNGVGIPLGEGRVGPLLVRGMVWVPLGEGRVGPMLVRGMVWVPLGKGRVGPLRSEGYGVGTSGGRPSGTTTIRTAERTKVFGSTVQPGLRR